MLYSYVLASAAIFGAAFAVPSRNVQYQTFEKLHNAPSGWTVDSTPVNSGSRMSLKMHLAQQNVDAFEKQVIDISTPGHPKYGQHMSPQEIKEMLQPSAETREGVTEWLAQSGVEYKINGDWIYIDTTVEKAEELLSTKYQSFKHEETGKLVARTLEYKLPAHLHAHVNMIQPTTMFGSSTTAMRKMINDISDIVSVEDFPTGALPAAYIASELDLHDGLNATACNTTITPDCLASLYKYKHFRPSRRNGNVMGIAGYLEQYYQEADLLKFEDTYKKKASGYLASCTGVNGGLCTQNPGPEFE